MRRADRPCKQTSVLDMLLHIGATRDDDVVAGALRDEREWQQRVQMTAQGIADEQNAHGFGLLMHEQYISLRVTPNAKLSRRS